MSAVRMCDKCGAVFSEREEFSIGTMSRVIRNKETGRRETVTEQIDLCEKCTAGNDVVRPMIAAVPADPAPGHKPAETVVDSTAHDA